MIEVRDLSFTYPKTDRPVLQNLHFEIAEGEIFGFLGPSGAGKSTTQKVLYKILPGFSGEVLVQGKPLQQWGTEYLERIGVGFEMPNHYLKLTGLENLKLFAAFYRKEKIRPLRQLFEMVGLEDAIDKPVQAYSKGMKVRLNFIRAIMHDPETLFFDEPTAGLDPGNAHKIKEHILNLRAERKTIFITTHNMTTADELCDRVAFIVDGQLRMTDQPATLKNRYGKEAVQVRLKSGLKREFPLKGLGDNQEFAAFLRKGEVTRIDTLEATLEEVFLQVTGQALTT